MTGTRRQVLSYKIAGGWAKALERLRKSNNTVHRDEGVAALRAGRPLEAIDALRRHLAVRPHDGHSWVRLGNALKDTGRYDEAEAAYERGCKLKPRSSNAWLRRAYLAKFSGHNERAAAFFRRSFELDGNSEAGRELLRMGEHGASVRDAPDIVGCIDGLVANSIFGWCVDPDGPEGPAELEFLQNGLVVGEGRTSLPRPDVVAAGFSNTHAGFRIALSSDYRAEAGAVVARLARSKRTLVNSPYQPSADDHVAIWLKRWDGLASHELEELCDSMDRETAGSLLSIIMPVYNTPVDWLRRAINSVISQFCSRWELLCVDDASTEPLVQQVLTEFSAVDSRIKVIRREKNGGVSAAVNDGIRHARGKYVAFLDHDDALEPEAVYRVLKESLSGHDIIYTDEVICGEDIDVISQVVARPSFSYDYYISHPYFVHFVSVKRSLAKKVGGYDLKMNISMDVDFVLRILENSKSVSHIPVPLYRWRTHDGSAGHEKIDAVMDATRRSLERHHARTNSRAEVSNGLTFNTFRHDFPSCAKSLIIIPTKNRVDLLKPCVDSLLLTTESDVLIVDHDSNDQATLDYMSQLPNRVKVIRYSGPFNFSAMNNRAVEEAGSGYDLYLFANNDVEAIEAGWIEHMQGLCLREDVGAVGALLLYSDGSVQHGGVVLNVGGPAEHVYKNAPSNLGEGRNPGYISGLVSVRDFSAVTGACMMVRADIFKTVGGFDPLLAVGFNDIDLCLRIREAGYKVLFDGHAVLYHHESATRMTSKQLSHPKDTSLMSARWSDLMGRHDPYFSPLFSDEAPALHEVRKTIDPFRPAHVSYLRRKPSVGRGSSKIPPSIVVN